MKSHSTHISKKDSSTILHSHTPQSCWLCSLANSSKGCCLAGLATVDVRLCFVHCDSKKHGFLAIGFLVEWPERCHTLESVESQGGQSIRSRLLQPSGHPTSVELVLGFATLQRLRVVHGNQNQAPGPIAGKTRGVLDCRQTWWRETRCQSPCWVR